MRYSFIIFSAIIFCNLVIGCDVNSADCPDRGKTRKSDYGSIGGPGEMKKRRKRATDSKFQQISKAFGPYARLCNALSLCNLLLEPVNNTIPHIVAEFLNLKHSMMDDLLAFDPSATSILIADLRNSLALNETDLDKITTEIEKILMFRRDFDALKPDAGKMKMQYIHIKNSTSLGSGIFDQLENFLKTVEGTMALFDSWATLSGADALIGKDFANDLDKFLSALKHSRDKYVLKLKQNIVSPSVFEPIKTRIKDYRNFFKPQVSNMFHTEEPLKLGDYLKRSKPRDDSIRVLEVFQYLAENGEKSRSPLIMSRMIYTRTFVGGPSDLKLHGQEMKSPMFEKLFKTKEDFLSCQKSLEPVASFGETMMSSHSALLEKAITPSLQNHSMDLLNHLTNLDTAGSSGNYSSYVDGLKQALSSPYVALDDSAKNKFTMMFAKFKEVKNAQKVLEEKLAEFISTNDFKWWIQNEEDLNKLHNLIRNMNDENSYNNVKANSYFTKILSSTQQLNKTLPDVKTAAEKLKLLLTGVADWEKLVISIENNMETGIRQLWEKLADNPKKILEAVTIAKDQLATNMDEQKITLDDFHSMLQGQLDSISKSLEPLQQSKKPFIIDVWPKWADREKTENKLTSGLLVYDFYDRAMEKKAEVLDMVQKNGKVRMLAYKEKKNVPAAVFTKMMDGNLASYRVNGMYDDLGHFARTFDPTAHPLSDNLTDFTTNILFIKSPGIVVSDWIEANKMLIGTKVDQQSVQEALNSSLKVDDLVLDFASYRVWKLTGTLTHKLRFFMHLVYMKPIRLGPAPRLPKPFSPKDPVFIFLGLLMTSVLIWFFIPIIRWFYMKKIGNQILKQIRLLEKCRSKEAQAEIKIVPENFHSIKEMFRYRKKVRKAWYRKSKSEDKRSRFEFRRLLVEERENGSDFESSIRTIAEAIQQSYIEYRGQERSDEERGNYFLNQIGNFVTLSNRLFRIVKNNIPSRQIWQGLTKLRFKILVDFNNLWCDDYQTELLHRIRGLPNTRILFWSEELPIPFKNLEMHKVWRTTTGHTMLYIKYQNFPTGFAPFELTPCQIMYEMIDEMKDADGDDVAVGCMDRDADTRSMIMPMIDDMMFIMTHGDELEDLFEIGELMAMQRLRSLDLVTTVQIEFCLYVCFKIINDESPMPQPMFNEDKTEFLRDLEDAWACSWLKNYESYQNYYESQNVDRLIVPEDRDQHFYLQHKPKLEEMKESVIQFMERRKKYVMSCGKPDPYKKETKKEAEQRKKDQ